MKVKVLPRDGDGRLIVDGYARMSVGLDGKEENVENQLDDIRKIIANNGWTVGELYSDGMSAWKRGVRRPGWDALIERMRAGTTGGVVVWHQDRLMRQPRDLETLFEIADDRELKLASAHGKRDLANPDDRFIMRIEVGHACRSSDDTSRRQKRKNAGRRRRGQILGGGARPFGWPGKSGEPELVERERKAVIAAFDDVLDGKATLWAIAKRWNEAGLLTTRGNLWTNRTVKETMLGQRYAGRIEHDGEVVGVIEDHKPMVEPETFDAVQQIFAGRRTGRPNGKTSLASGIVRCGKCGQTVVSRPKYNRKNVPTPTYRCSKPRGCGGVQINQDVVNGFLRSLVIKRLSDPRIARTVSAQAAQQNARLIEVRAKLSTAMATEVALAEKLGAGEMSLEAFSAAQSGTHARVKALGEEVAVLEAQAADEGALEAQSRLEVRTEWDKADNAKQREMLKSALRLVQVFIDPIGTANWRTIPAVERLRVSPVQSGTGNTTDPSPV